MKYQDWLRDSECCNNIKPCDEIINPCDCDNIILELSKQHTDDLILQDEIDDLSGITQTKLDISAYTPIDLTEYYTKEEVDELIPDVPSLSGYATKQWVEDKGYLTAHQQLKTINGETLIGEGNIIVSGASIDAYTKAESDNKYQPKGDYAINSTLIQYISNLQEQIDSLKSQVSGCCGSSGDTTYRWITMTGENDYWCSGTTKYSKEKQQSSTDGITWTDTGNIRNGSTILEENCVECGYTGDTILSSVQNRYLSSSPTKIANECSNNVVEIHIAYNPNSIVISGCATSVDYGLASGNTTYFEKNNTSINDYEFSGTNVTNVGLSSEITSIGNYAFAGNAQLKDVAIGNYSRLFPNQEPESNIQQIGNYAFSGCSNLTRIQLSHANQVPILGTGAFDGCNLEHIYVKASMLSAFKTASGWSQYANIIIGI